MLQTELPLMVQKFTEDTVIEQEYLRHFWSVNTLYDFENMGFTNTVRGIKYLVCADCEMGPVGYYDLSTKIAYIALKRIADN